MISSTRSASRTSPTRQAKLNAGNNCFKSCSMVYSANSLCSNSTSLSGEKRATWRQISEPIDPPAPVIITTLPLSKPCNPASSSTTGSRPSRSSSSIARNCDTATLPLIKSSNEGTVRTFNLAWLHRWIARLRSWCELDGIATITCSTPSRLDHSCRLSKAPNTRTPFSVCPCFSASSSRKPTKRHSRLLLKSLARLTAASPAPNIKTGSPYSLIPPYSPCSFQSR